MVFFLSSAFSPSPLPLRTTPFCSLSTANSPSSAAIVWFKQDLRLHDHPGLLRASAFPSMLPLYVFDHRILSRYSDEMLEVVLFALGDIRKSLKEQGSNLMIRFGGAEDVIRNLVEEVEATDVFAEEEVEYHLRLTMKSVEDALDKSALSYRNPKIVPWRTPFYDIKNLKDLPPAFVELKKLPLTSPLMPPTLPKTVMELDWG